MSAAPSPPTLLSPSTASPSYMADLHLPLSSGGAEIAAQKACAALSISMHNQIDLRKKHMPHVTLYLTEWQARENNTLDDALSDALYGLAAHVCNVTLHSPYAVGNFAMLNVQLTPCLQRYSDTVVNATYKLAQQNQSVPLWVDNLPEPERSEKVRAAPQPFLAPPPSLDVPLACRPLRLPTCGGTAAPMSSTNSSHT